MSRKNPPARRSSSPAASSKTGNQSKFASKTTTPPQSGSRTRFTSGQSLSETSAAKAHDFTPHFKWAFRFAFAGFILFLLITAFNSIASTLHYAEIGKASCEPIRMAERVCDAQRCLNRQEVQFAVMEAGLDRQQRCRLGEPVTVQDHAARLWKAWSAPAVETIETMELVTQTAEAKPEPYIDPDSGQGGPEAEAPPSRE